MRLFVNKDAALRKYGALPDQGWHLLYIGMVIFINKNDVKTGQDRMLFVDYPCATLRAVKGVLLWSRSPSCIWWYRKCSHLRGLYGCSLVHLCTFYAPYATLVPPLWNLRPKVALEGLYAKPRLSAVGRSTREFLGLQWHSLSYKIGVLRAHAL